MTESLQDLLHRVPQSDVLNALVPPDIRRALRKKLGSRTQRRANTKSHGHKKPRERLAEAIAEWQRTQSRAILEI